MQDSPCAQASAQSPQCIAFVVGSTQVFPQRFCPLGHGFWSSWAELEHPVARAIKTLVVNPRTQFFRRIVFTSHGFARGPDLTKAVSVPHSECRIGAKGKPPLVATVCKHSRTGTVTRGSFRIELPSGRGPLACA
jgi:hypothetical protein